tara:strand:+ start:457 stop:684 length:228 start_codon:yes stop_codon:yes gene_type:complete
MGFSIILLLILITILAIYSFVILNLNSSIVNFDLLFIEIDLHLGSLVLSALCLGIIIATIMELIYFSSKKKNKDE